MGWDRVSLGLAWRAYTHTVTQPTVHDLSHTQVLLTDFESLPPINLPTPNAAKERALGRTCFWLWLWLKPPLA